jgi:hypothetical protein
VSAIASARLWIDPGLTKEDWRTVAAHVRVAEEAGDGLVMRDLQTGIPFSYYYQGTLEPQFVSFNQQTRSLGDLSQGYQRLWLVYRRPFESAHALAGSGPFTWRDEDDPLLRDWLAVHESELVGERTFPGVYVVLYQTSAEASGD